jgi:hypothetical protein
VERLTLEEAICRVRGVAKKQRWNSKYTKVSLMNEELNKQHKADCVKDAEEHEQLAEWLEKLKSYEDLEEQGLLVRLPDDLNRILYQVNYRWKCTEYGEENNKCEIYDCKCECDIRKEYYIAEVDLQYILIKSYYNCLGEFLFLTREEAEKKLEEMRNNGSKK